MAGGSGTRFWPFSREAYPKQFQDILGIGKSLLQLTVERFQNICPLSNIHIVTHQKYKTITQEQLPEISEDQILTEPFKRNTAPCIAYACYRIHAKNPEANVVVAPADHLIVRQDAFEQALVMALETAQTADKLITLGIKPHRPDTGYGYIQLTRPDSFKVQKVKTFTEKPNLELAKAFLDSGDYIWNAGLFVWTTKNFLKALQKHVPTMAGLLQEAVPYFFTPNEMKALTTAYSQCHTVSIDYAVMEKADNVYVLPCDLGWSDLGNWKSLYEYSEHNEDGNSLDGKYIMTYETKDSIIKTSEDKLVLVQGLENYIVAEHERVLLICRKDQEQRVKAFLEDVRLEGLEQFL